jgi:hypothetical protein
VRPLPCGPRSGKSGEHGRPAAVLERAQVGVRSSPRGAICRARTLDESAHTRRSVALRRIVLTAVALLALERCIGEPPPMGQNAFAMTSFDDWPHTIWNIGATVVALVAAIAIFIPRSRPLRQGWKSTALWVVSLFISLYIAGLYTPIGPIAVLHQLRRGWATSNELAGVSQNA